MSESSVPRVLPTFLLILGYLAVVLPPAHGQERSALELSGATVTIDDDQDVLRLGTYTYEFWLKDLQGPTGSWRNVFCKGQGNSTSGRGPLLALRPSEQRHGWNCAQRMAPRRTRAHRAGWRPEDIRQRGRGCHEGFCRSDGPDPGPPSSDGHGGKRRRR